MHRITRVSVLRRHLVPLRKKGHRIALVPTMGALHEGHLRLVDLARKHADVVVMSLYVNPVQFGPKEDFKRYPRPWQEDCALAAGRGVDVMFRPSSLYAENDSVRVIERECSLGRCGAVRPGHFDGVTTVVAKLFLIVQPDVAVFGQKDGQQLDVIERMVRDLYFPVKMVRAPIVRDRDGLAMSSRNRYLTKEERELAVRFASILREECSIGGAEGAVVARIQKRLTGLAGIRLEYVEAVRGRIHVAVYVGTTRLIDNRLVRAGNA